MGHLYGNRVVRRSSTHFFLITVGPHQISWTSHDCGSHCITRCDLTGVVLTLCGRLILPLGVVLHTLHRSRIIDFGFSNDAFGPEAWLEGVWRGRLACSVSPS